MVNALGPSLDYSVSAVIPESDAQFSGRPRVGLPGDGPALPRTAVPRAGQIGGPDKDAAWRATLSESAPDGWQWADLYSLNRTIVEDATDPYEIALRLEQYLRLTYDYTLEPPASDYPSPYAAFLFDTHAGYCQHFAGTMAMLLRFNGVPARVAVGFTTGERGIQGVYSVATNNAHAWVEAYFPTVGWVAFDPTPGRSLPDCRRLLDQPGVR